MNEKDIRIGNWVSNIHDIPMIVKAIYKDTIYVDFKGNVGALWEFNKYEPFKPIELTEEILLKCGFSKQGFYFLHPDSTLMQIEVSLSRKCFINCLLAIEIKHLHQLQNLYFALKGTELKIEL